MIFKKFVLGALKNNAFVFGDFINNFNEVAIVDVPQGSIEIVDYIKQNNYNVKYIFLTHTHFDHVRDLELLRNEFPYAEVVLSEDELDDISGTYVRGGEMFDVGGINCKILSTPGHTAGGLSFLADDILFSGDTLFYETVGRCDLPGGNFQVLIQSIKDEFLTLPDEITVWPGHGMETTIGHERENNQYLVTML